ATSEWHISKPFKNSGSWSRGEADADRCSCPCQYAEQSIINFKKYVYFTILVQPGKLHILDLKLRPVGEQPICLPGHNIVRVRTSIEYRVQKHWPPGRARQHEFTNAIDPVLLLPL